VALVDSARLGGALIAVTILAAACGGAGEDDTQSKAARTTSQEQPAVREGELLLQDDFSDSSSGWRDTTRKEGEARYVEGAYRITAKQARRQIWSEITGPTVQGLRLEFEATQVAGTTGDLVGVRCYTDADSNAGYVVGIAPVEPGYALASFRGDEYRLLESSGEPVEAIRPLREQNQLRVECLTLPGGPTVLTLAVNGQELVRAEDEAGHRGFDGVGLFVDTTEGGADAIFDDFVMIELLPD
jgi:hypothetical protein